METSLFIAKLIGPILVVTGLIGLLTPKALHEVAEGFLANRSLIFIAGSMALLAGLAIVNTHNLWVAGWPVIITIFGWIAILAGIVRMAFPGIVRSIAETMLASSTVLRVLASLNLALGAYLMVKGYL